MTPKRTYRATCHAEHPDPKKRGHACGRILGDVPGPIEFVTTAAQCPGEPDGDIWLACQRKQCGKWNRFKLVVERGRLV